MQLSRPTAVREAATCALPARGAGKLLLCYAIAGLISLAPASTVQAKEPISVVLDSWWNEDYAKNFCENALRFYKEDRALIAQVGCNSVAGCNQYMPIVSACQANDPSAAVRDFEDRLATYLAVDPQCKDVHFMRFAGPSGDKTAASDALERESHWTLFLDYRPGAVMQPWTLIRNKPDAVTKGEGDPQEVAKNVCAVATNQGAKLD